ncbi:MAG: glycoside hydrolase family 95 protein [Planctomycetaceae bacterium]|nr:glycoside hydrolase family 95 protein [Planctomycetaceae bacterium]
MNRKMLCLFFFAVTVCGIFAETGWDHYKLWYNKPASEWLQALPVGNGRLGAMVYGGVFEETIQLNDDTVWAGPPVAQIKPGFQEAMQKARQLWFDGQYTEAERTMQGAMAAEVEPRSYQTLGEFHLKMLASPEGAEYKNYRRELDLDRAVATTSFTLNGVTYTRQVFSSKPARVIVVRMTADKPGMLSLEASLDRRADCTLETSQGTLDILGQAQHESKHLGVKYHCRVRAQVEGSAGGRLISKEKGLRIENADTVTFFISSSTDYNISDPAKPLTHDRRAACDKTIAEAMALDYPALLQAHVTEQQRLFRRCGLDLGGWEKDSVPTDQRLAAMKEGVEDPSLAALYFQYGRYLLMSSSRPGDLPANLQGIWADKIRQPWNADYHININIQMNYWPAEITNLSECHEPFFDFVEHLTGAGQKAASQAYGCRGMTASHTTDAWLFSVPFGSVKWGLWPHGLGWCSQHFMEHYRFTGDRTFLQQRAWPVLKDCALFYLDYLTPDPRTGKLVSGLENSPENTYLTPDGAKANVSMGGAMSQQIIWDVFTNTLEAATILGIDDEFVRSVKSAKDNLAAPQIGADGRLMEWALPFEEAEPGHRHMSHLFALHPGRQYNIYDSPEMVAAARKTIDYRLARGGGHTGWSRAWIISFWSRFHEPQKAYENLVALFTNSTLSNLFDNHPPFQIDGNFGGTAGIAEMLLQSHVGDSEKGYLVELLPALPKAWADGHVSGLCARGGYEVDITWKDGVLQEAAVRSKLGQRGRIQYGRTILPITLQAGQSKTFSAGEFQAPQTPANANALVLWYSRPAEKWEQALPVGNGRMGAMVFGQTAAERIQFNEDTLWTGQPQTYQHPGAAEVLPELRKLLFEGKQKEAEQLASERFMSVPLKQCAYQPCGDLRLTFDGHDSFSDYKRSLDIENAVADVAYTSNGVRFKREIFASYPDRIIAVRLTADKPGGLSFGASFDSPHKEHQQKAIGSDGLVLSGRVTKRGDNDTESLLRFQAQMAIKAEGGKVEASDDRISVSGADSATILLTAATSYVNYNDISKDPAAVCSKVMESALTQSYEDLKARHVDDYRKLFGRVKLDLGTTPAAQQETDARIANFKTSSDPQLATLYFQYGRYLLIASSREGSQPANLQGVWNESLTPPWGSKYTVNINTEMNYWPAEMTNLSECAEPLFGMIADCSKTGALTAKTFYDCPGWVLHHNTDLWRGTAAINASNHGIWPTGGAWLCQHLWLHYQYTQDVDFLRTRAYPILKSAAEFFAAYLVEDPRTPEKWLISGPSNSPEQGGLVMGPTMDHQIIRSLFGWCIEASQILDVDAQFRSRLMELRGRIAPDKVGQHGQLQEWLEDVDDPKNQHRHASHMWGLHPGNEITRDGTPQLYAAARKSLEMRGDGGTGWSMGWKINLWARLHDGDHAYTMLSNQLTPERTLPNLFDTHPPFQIDGNFGAASGIGEMLLQSHAGFIELLAALPSAWPAGSVKGMRARGGFEVDMAWQDGRLTQATIKSLAGQPCLVQYRGATLNLKLQKGESKILTAGDFEPKF